MNRIDLCLSHIQAVRSVANGQEPPYVARSRIGRLAESAASLAAEYLGAAERVLPGKIEVPQDSPRPIKALTQCCNRILDLARHTAQPSEPLDHRWKRAWTDLLRELEVLEESLSTLREYGNDA